MESIKSSTSGHDPEVEIQQDDQFQEQYDVILRRLHSEPDSSKRPRSSSCRHANTDSWRRSRMKTVLSRRHTFSSSSGSVFSPDEAVDPNDEDEEFISCFDDVPEEDHNHALKGDGNQEDIVRERVLNRQESNRSRSSGRYSSVRSRDSKLRNSFKEKDVSEDYFYSHLSSGDQIIYINEDEEEAAFSEKEQDENIDFVDMALSRDNPDMGLGRADPNYNSLQKQRLKQDETVPKLVKFKRTVEFGWFDITIGILAITVFFVDIGTDIELASHYFREEMWMYGGVTLALIIAPSLITCFLGLHWYIIDYKKERQLLSKLRSAKKKVHVTPNYVWFIRFTCTLLQIGPVVRIIEYLRCGHKSNCSKLTEHQRRRFYLFMLYEDVDSCLLRLFESFLESAPQLTWQLYIAIVLKPSEDVVGTSIRCIALLSSWASLAISLVSYHKSLRNSHDEKAKMSTSSLPFYFIWRASEVGGRVICIAMFASTFQLWVFGPLLFHWVFMSFWLMIQKTTFYKNKCLERFFNVICGYVMIFCFLNLREGVTRFRFLFFYIFTYCESFFMLALWFRFSPDLGAWFHIWGFIVVLVLFILHVMFQLLYYSLFHPTGNIQLCMECDPYVIYSSTCYEIFPKTSRPQPYTRNYPPEQEIIISVNGTHRSSSYRSDKGYERPHSTQV